MSQQTLNLGILAHVDAGKTTLTERFLYTAGIIDEPGSVDAGTTQTDSLSLERQRGITIKSAVASFAIGDLAVNLIDTPGHPDFIAEVERVLGVLDGGVLVVSAVEGVQPQTRILMRALRRSRIPTLVFVNKIDRAGARGEPVLREISQRLGIASVPMGSTAALGTPAATFDTWDVGDAAAQSALAETLAEHDEAILTSFVEDGGRLSPGQLHRQLRAQTEHGLVHPVYFGSAITGAGVESLMAGIADLLPAAKGSPKDAVSGTVFKIERGAAGEKIAYVRLFSGVIQLRDRVRYGREHEDTITALDTLGHDSADHSTSVVAGGIAKLFGLRRVQVGDRIGRLDADESEQQFAPPTLESVVEALNPSDRARLRVALEQLAEQDPLIMVRQDDSLNEISVSLYGEVQKEVIQATLANDFGIETQFRETTTICIERPVGKASAAEYLTDDANPYMATIALRVDPARNGSGVRFRLDFDPRRIPLHIYKTTESFVDHMTQYVRRSLSRGLYGWEVTDCIVTMTDCDYYGSDGPTKPTVPMSRTASVDFRKLTPIVVEQALKRAATHVCEPRLRLKVETPSAAVGDLLTSAARLGGAVESTSARGDLSTIEVLMSADRASDLQRQLPGLTGGEGSVESAFVGYQPVRGAPPVRYWTSVRSQDLVSTSNLDDNGRLDSRF